MPDLITTYGDFSTALVTRESYRRRYDGLDSGSISLVDNRVDSYTPGQICPGLSIGGLTIREDAPSRNGEVWEHELDLFGIIGQKTARRLKRSIQAKLDGFDGASETWLTSNPNLIVTGSRMSGYGNMVCNDADPEELEISGWYHVRASFIGIARTKTINRSITSNGRVISLESLINYQPGGWNTARKSEIQWPNLVVNFKYWTTYIPVKTLPEQGGRAPGDLYPVVYVGGTGDVTAHWPNGWRCNSFNAAPIPGTTICENTESWEYQQKYSF